jgi:hypothetical protein
MEVADKNLVGEHAEADPFIAPESRSLEVSERSDALPAPATPGESPDMVHVIRFDQEKVEEAAAWISAKVAATLRRGAEDVGEYLLERFFADDPKLARSHNPYKNVSFRKLAEKCGTPDLPVSKTWLNNAVGIALMLRRLPDTAQAFRRLPPSYQESLLPLRDPNKIERLAKQAVAYDLSFRQLRDAVAEERARSPESAVYARRALPSVVKAVNRASRLLVGNAKQRPFSLGEVGTLEEAERQRLKASVEVVMNRLREILGRIG